MAKQNGQVRFLESLHPPGGIKPCPRRVNDRKQAQSRNGAGTWAYMSESHSYDSNRPKKPQRSRYNGAAGAAY
jgi:hypothetical protein